jgi:succinate-acetate transporter protein
MAPLGLAGLALAAWLLARGFTERESVGVKEMT